MPKRTPPARRLPVAALLAVACAALRPADRAAACSCATLSDVPSSMEEADAVFLGRVSRLDEVAPTVAERSAGAKPGPYVARFRVQRVYKGDVAKVTAINLKDAYSGTSCTFEPRRSQRYIVFAYRTGPSRAWLDRLADALRTHLATPDGRRHAPIDPGPLLAAYTPGTLASGYCGMVRHMWFMPRMSQFREMYRALGPDHAPIAAAAATATAAAAATAMATAGWSPAEVATRFAPQSAPPWR